MNDEEIKIKQDEFAVWLEGFITGFESSDPDVFTYNRLIELVMDIRLKAKLIKPVNPELANKAVVKANHLNEWADELREQGMNMSTINR